MPSGVTGHFGPELRRFVLFQYHQGQVTVPRLLAQLRALGIVISKRQVVRLLTKARTASSRGSRRAADRPDGSELAQRR